MVGTERIQVYQAYAPVHREPAPELSLLVESPRSPAGRRLLEDPLADLEAELGLAHERQLEGGMEGGGEAGGAMSARSDREGLMTYRTACDGLAEPIDEGEGPPTHRGEGEER
jgi:hypothetical protein